MLCLLSLLVACSGGVEEVPRDFPKPMVLGGRTYSPGELAHGADLYSQYCRPCHGVRGDGQGHSAAALSPAPRDLRLGLFKFASVAAGQLPTDQDLARTITRGLSGTAMRGWDVPSAELGALIGYLKTFSPRWATETPGTPLSFSPDPWPSHEREAVLRGELVYHGLAQCAVACHPAYLPRGRIIAAAKALTGMELRAFRADLYDAVPKPSDYGVTAVPPDFTFDPLRTGPELANIYQVIASGVGGTAMPTWKGVLAERDLWALAYYVRSLALLRDTPGATALRASLLASP